MINGGMTYSDTGSHGGLAPVRVEYQPDSDLRDTEQIPLQKQGGIESFLRREILSYATDAWNRLDSVMGRLQDPL